MNFFVSEDSIKLRKSDVVENCVLTTGANSFPLLSVKLAEVSREIFPPPILSI